MFTLRPLVRRTERLLNGLSPSAPRVSGPTIAVGHEVVPALEALDGALGLRPEDTVGGDPELLLDAPHGRAAVAALDDDLARGAGTARCRGAGVRECGHGGHGECSQREQHREMRTTHGVENPCHLTFPLSSAYGVS